MSRAAISAHLRQIGIGYGSPTLQECVINSIQKHSALKDLMTDLDVLLFDAHDTKIAESLLKRRVNSLTLFEVSQPFSKKMKG
ncbi:hypothetical protein L596_027903 [Steinernema carpocapsae]|uniref:Uncharacterized protein n=1 Tax=Steinernema carpocapsae TaxID=34508 RepID=A0A4U5LWX4_STECR|nr:hypothetical protein L596_027903 [Steinernema carpocapsae]